MQGLFKPLAINAVAWEGWSCLTNTMEQTPFWEPKSSSASQEILRIPWNPKVHYRVHKSPPHDPFLTQINLLTDVFTVKLSYHLHPVLPSRLFPSGLPTKHLYSRLLSPIRSTSPAHLFCLSLMRWGFIGWGAQIINFDILLTVHPNIMIVFFLFYQLDAQILTIFGWLFSTQVTRGLETCVLNSHTKRVTIPDAVLIQLSSRRWAQ